MGHLKDLGFDDVHLYNPIESSVGGIHALFITRGDPTTYNLPPHPEVPTKYLRRGWASAGVAAGMLVLSALLAFLGNGDGS
jgi:formate dehydrogenase iron-sulfur subunit